MRVRVETTCPALRRNRWSTSRCVSSAWLAPLSPARATATGISGIRSPGRGSARVIDTFADLNEAVVQEDRAPSGYLDRVVVVRGLDDEVAADSLLGFGVWSVHDTLSVGSHNPSRRVQLVAAAGTVFPLQPGRPVEIPLVSLTRLFRRETLPGVLAAPQDQHVLRHRTLLWCAYRTRPAFVHAGPKR